jgi:peptidoglycan/xylan/chitin deacetylase (PgdA/CDA1 family)
MKVTSAVRILALSVAVAGCAWGLAPTGAAAGRSSSTPWPEGKRSAVSLSFDDARVSQLEVGVPLFKELGAAVTFYLTATNIGNHGAEWKAAAAAGHELGNHTMTHPCTGHFPWSRARALEDYTPARIEAELTDATRAIADATGVTPVTFAYPCGQSFYGRGASAASYIPLVARHFVAGRGYGDETPNDVGVLDLARALGVSIDEKTFEDLRPVVDQAIAEGEWLVLVGHDIGATPGRQVTRVETLRTLVAYLKEPAKRVWLDTVAHVATHLAGQSTTSPAR